MKLHNLNYQVCNIRKISRHPQISSECRRCYLRKKIKLLTEGNSITSGRIYTFILVVKHLYIVIIY